MNSLAIAEFKKTIENYIEIADFPWELKRLVINEIELSVSEKAKTELIMQINERKILEGAENE